MNIIMPIAGLGSRFLKEQYKLPKPLIDVKGKPMIVRALETLDLDGNYFFLIRKDGYQEEIVSAIKSLIPKAVFEFIDYITEGPACSALLLTKYIDDSELVIANCDQIMSWNSKHFLYNARYPEYDGVVVTYHSDTEKNSYALLDKNGFVVCIKEKEVISTVSLNGIHYWKNGLLFVQGANDMIECQDRAYNKEFYIGPSYNYLIKRGHRIGVYNIPNEQHHSVGVPLDLEKYLLYCDNK